MAYVDLNPVRAGECERLEDAEWTSIGARLKQAAASDASLPDAEVDVPAEDESAESKVSARLVPFADQVTELEQLSENDVGNAARNGDESLKWSSRRVTPIPMNFVDYIELLD